MRKITEAIIHCTATRADWWASRATSQKVREIKRWHVEDRGWSDVGYHFLIDRDGTVAEGRPIERNGAHVKGHNKGTIGISLFGGHGGSENDAFADNFTPEQDAALRDLLDTLKAEYVFSKVTGHNEYAAKACPSFNVSRWLGRKTPERKVTQSTTLKAAAGTAVAGAGGVATAISKLDPTAQAVVLGFAGVSLLGLGWIARERIRKWAAGDR